MKRAAAALLAAVLLAGVAAEAHTAARCAVVGRLDPAVNPGAYAQQEQAVMGMLQNLGIEVDYYHAGITQQQLKTEWCGKGVFAAGPSQTPRAYDFVVHIGYMQRGYTNLGFYCPESLLFAARWPTVPQIYVGAPVAAPNHMGGTGASDTLAGVIGPGAFSSAYTYTHALYRPGRPEVWRHLWGGMWYVRKAGSPPAGIFRPLIGYGVTASMDGNFRAAFRADSMGFSNFPDTLLMWARYRSSLEPAPQITLYPTASQTTGAYGMFAMALAMVDSTLGGKLSRDNEAWTKSISIVVRNGFSRGLYRSYATLGGGGTFCYADSCDSTNVKAGADSLATLKTYTGAPLPITLAAQLDSIPSYPYELAWWSRIPGLKYVPSSLTGTQVGMSGTNASKYRLVDVFGVRRARRLIPPGATTLPATCSATDSSIYCLIRAGFARADSLWPGKVDHAIFETEGDYLPTTITRNDQSKLDSLHWVIYHAGAKAVVIQPTLHTSSPGTSHYTTLPNTFSSLVTSAAGTNPIAAAPVAGRAWVWNAPAGYIDLSNRSFSASGTYGGGYLGTLNLLASRYYIAPEGPINFNTTHDYHLELLWGRLIGQWYLSKIPNYYHYFDTGMSVLEISAGNLGGWAAPAPNVVRPGWWAAKWLVNEANAINRLCYPGRPMLKFTYLEENQP